MSRSKWKGFFIEKNYLTIKQKKTKKIQIWSRSSTISESLLNKNVYIYNGKNFKRIKVNRAKVGYKFGEFASTRKTQKKSKNKNLIKR